MVRKLIKKLARKLSRKAKLCILIATANSWSSDIKGRGLALLSLGTTRRIHSETHRAECVKEINDNIAWRKNLKKLEEPYRANDIENLEALLEKVKSVRVKHEWLTDWEDRHIHEELFKQGLV